MNISIRDVTEENIQEVLKLSVHESQKNHIETTQQCLKDARECNAYIPVGLYADNNLVGFAMYGYFPGEGDHGRVWLDRYLIDSNYQGYGYGKSMLHALIQKLIIEYACEKIYLSVYEDNEAAIHLYKKFDFHFNGELDVNDEKVMVKHIYNLNGKKEQRILIGNR